MYVISGSRNPGRFTVVAVYGDTSYIFRVFPTLRLAEDYIHYLNGGKPNEDLLSYLITRDTSTI